MTSQQIEMPGAAARPAPEAQRPVRALVVIDGSERTGRVLELTMTLARKGLSLEAILLSVIAEPPDGRLRGHGSFKRKEIHARLRAIMETRAVAAAARRLDHAGIVHEDQIEVGDPAATILRVAGAEHCDLIVIGEPPAGVLRRWLPRLSGLSVATVASEVARQAEMPVVVVR
jgi:nucleotide-binding universal stress UspA family protein